MDVARLNIESVLLAKHFPKRYCFMDMNTDNPYLDLGLISNSGKLYRCMIELSSFPHRLPSAYIRTPELTDHHGRNLADLGGNGLMHVLGRRNGMLHICHYSCSKWHQNVTLTKVGLKLRVWIEAYEAHLRTGKLISHYLHR